MPLVSTAELVSAARAAGHGVAAFNIITLEHAEAVAAGAEQAGAPAILQVSENAVRFHEGRLGPLAAAAAAVAAEEGLGKLARWLDANGEGADELFMGDRICFADILVASTLVWAKVAFGEDSDEWKRISAWHGGKWKRVLDRLAKYEVVDN